MRIVVTGASGNVGTSVLAALGRDPRVEAVVGLARRTPQARFPKTSWVAADITSADLGEHFRDADAVIHLAWLIQPSRDPAAMHAVNVEGTARVLHAAAAAGVGALIHASSVGVYSPGPEHRRVDESWAPHGIDSSTYSRHQVEAERQPDRFAQANEGVRVVWLC
ncbi:MAG: NAD-dependent epimerase/dehydratase family protein, partial [Thermoleophilaceae bacterium]